MQREHSCRTYFPKSISILNSHGQFSIIINTETPTVKAILLTIIMQILSFREILSLRNTLRESCKWNLQ